MFGGSRRRSVAPAPLQESFLNAFTVPVLKKPDAAPPAPLALTAERAGGAAPAAQPPAEPADPARRAFELPPRPGKRAAPAGPEERSRADPGAESFDADAADAWYVAARASRCVTSLDLHTARRFGTQDRRARLAPRLAPPPERAARSGGCRWRDGPRASLAADVASAVRALPGGRQPAGPDSPRSSLSRRSVAPFASAPVADASGHAAVRSQVAQLVKLADSLLPQGSLTVRGRAAVERLLTRARTADDVPAAEEEHQPLRARLADAWQVTAVMPRPDICLASNR